MLKAMAMSEAPGRCSGKGCSKIQGAGIQVERSRTQMLGCFDCGLALKVSNSETLFTARSSILGFRAESCNTVKSRGFSPNLDWLLCELLFSRRKACPRRPMPALLQGRYC